LLPNLWLACFGTRVLTFTMCKCYDTKSNELDFGSSNLEGMQLHIRPGLQLIFLGTILVVDETMDP
jgi:hypothetical protein